MRTIINDDFMLHSDVAKKLYHDFAEKMPIIDYHCHLSPEMIASNYQFKNVGELFLGGDHYKWRQMRTYGIDEKYITGDASDYEKFEKFAELMPYMIGNPIYHWTHLELKRYFGIDEPLSKDNCKEVWDKANALLATEAYRAKGLIEMSNVKVLCTTDDPGDDLRFHIKLREEGFSCKVLPTFRPDKLVNCDKETFIPYLRQFNITSYDEAVDFLVSRIAFFNENGCRLADHALEYVPFAEGDARAVFEKAAAGEQISEREAAIYKTAMLSVCAKEYVKYGFTMQLHIGALRNNNSKMYEKLGADTGYDSINDLSIAEPLSAFMNYLDKSDILPKTILYTLNPKDNYVLGTMLGNFQKAPVRGKIQFGSAWWFNDQRDGMEEQMKALANLGLISCFVGMLTDSRSFVSYPRHEYFRRILCNLIGGWVADGEYPEDYEALGKIIKGICYENAKEYFNF